MTLAQRAHIDVLPDTGIPPGALVIGVLALVVVFAIAFSGRR